MSMRSLRRVEHLQQQGAHEFLRRNRGTAGVGIDQIEKAIQPCQRFIDQPSDRPQRMTGWNKILQLGHDEQILLHCIGSTHRMLSTKMNMISITLDLQTSFIRDRFSTAC
jgi:hypothetical protein